MANTLPPVPITAIQDMPPAFQDWLRKLSQVIAGTGGAVTFNSLDFTASNLSSILTRNHNDLQNIQGGTSGKYYHQTDLQNARKVLWKDSDTSRATTTTLANDPDLIFAVNANEKWVGRCFLDATAALKTTGIKITIAAPTGASGNIHLMLATDATAAQEVFVSNTNTLGTAIDITAGSLPASATQAYIEICWRVANGANNGNISVQWAQSTSSGTNLTIGAGSQMTADRVA